ncbi:aminotransferase class III-fold pyridoxal phosphate-dependent enzyme [Actinosynnema sp. NPDC050436]|uniref:aminotransferase class III-fold pyridoxal phosphate-dependent enzyme n=1 Tax=Actinosynnema sp. NPDC050436 TaxID=3155659 RepID=UPI003405C328
MESTARTVFRPASARTVELIAEHNRRQRCTFMMASNYVNPAAAKLGYLLDRLVPAGQSGPRVSYLLSSGLEALSAAIKLARHSAVAAGRDDGGWVLLVDRHERYQEFMDPLGAGVEQALIPHVVSAPTGADAAARFPGTPWAAVVVVRYEDTDLREPALADLAAACRRRGGVVALSCTELDLSTPDLFANPLAAEVVVHGEGLTDRQLPFGSITMSPGAHEVWRNHVDCFAHTSTYGGNTLCAEVALDALDRAGLVTPPVRAVLDRIDADRSVAAEHWTRHVNPNIGEMAKVFNLDVDVRTASGGRFTTGDGRDVIDCAGGFGSNLRGHNPPDLVPDVLDVHDPDHDYLPDFERKLAGLTGLGRAFPSVSGAVANHAAVTLAALARPDRRTVVTFTGNYGGKTLFSLNLSKHGPQRTESVADAFRPYYADLVYVDPFADDAVEQLVRHVRGGDVAVVWFEYVQGANCRPLPDALLAAIDRHRDEHGYLVAVDEVLTGGWRTGRDYLAHQGVMRTADVVTLGKTISDMTVPAAAVVVSEDVYARAVATAPEHVERLRTEFRHNLGVHISLHALESVDHPELRAQHQAAYAELRTELDRLFAPSKVFGPVAGSGAHLKLTLHERFPRGGTLGTLLTLALSDLVHQRCQVYVPLLAIRHRVAADPADLRELAARLARGTRGITPLTVYKHLAGCLLGSKFAPLGRLLKGRAARSRVS